MPLFVREGSIIPVGGAAEWTEDLPADHITFLVYAGKDADFTFYEDDGLTYAYEKGQYGSFTLHWDDAAHILTLEQREGSFPGMLKNRTFCVSVIDPENPLPYDSDNNNALCINYDGMPCRIGL